MVCLKGMLFVPDLVIKWVNFLLLICLAGVHLSFPHQIYARPTTQVEQQINLLTSEQSTTNTTFSPTDNGLGLFLYEPDKFNGEKVYFEAVMYCNSCSGGNAIASAALYSDAGVVVAGSTISTSNSSYTHIRSGDISAGLNNDEYTVRFSLDAASGTAFIRTARLVIIQIDDNITHTQNLIELGNNDTTTNTSYELITAPKIYFWDDDVFSGIQNVYLEATLKSSDSEGVAYAALSSSTTCANTVSDSEVSVSGTIWDRTRSSNIRSNLTDDTDYWICVKSTADTTSSIASVKLIIDQTDATGIHNFQLIHPLINSPVTDSDSTYTSQNFIYLFDPHTYQADDVFRYFDATLQTSQETSDAFIRLFNASDSANIVSGELITNSTGYSRLRSNELSANLPSSIKTLDAQIKNENTAITTVSNAWLVQNVIRKPDSAITFSVGPVEAGVVNNAITTSVASTYNSLPFGNLTFNTPKYAAHALSVTTNAVSGYTVTVELQDFIQGLYPANIIDAFSHPWAVPAAWTQPTGDTPNDNTGWFGANTTDSRISNWIDAQGKFGAITDSPQVVMYSGTADSGTTAYVTYALEVNIWQPADVYQGRIVYNLLPVY